MLNYHLMVYIWQVGRINGCCLSSRRLAAEQSLRAMLWRGHSCSCRSCLGTARQAAASASEEESGWIWFCAVCLWPRCCYRRGGLSSLARAAAELGLEFTACCHLTFVPVSMALFCRSSLYRFTDQFPPGLTDFCQCNYGAVWGGMLKSAQLCVVSEVHTLCSHGSAAVRR